LLHLYWLGLRFVPVFIAAVLPITSVTRWRPTVLGENPNTARKSLVWLGNSQRRTESGAAVGGCCRRLRSSSPLSLLILLVIPWTVMIINHNHSVHIYNNIELVYYVPFWLFAISRHNVTRTTTLGHIIVITER